MPGDDDLLRAVDVREIHDLALRRARGRRPRARRRGRPRIAAIAPTPCGTASCMKRPRSRTAATASSNAERSGDDVGRVLAEAVSGRSRRRRSSPGRERAERGDGHRQDRGLRDLGSHELGLGPRKTQVRESDPERVVGGAKHRAGVGLGGQVLPHPGVLRSLTWKQGRERPHQRTALAAQVRPAPKAAIRMTSPRDDPARAHRLVESDRDRRGRGVPVAVDVDPATLRRDPEPLAHGVDDPLVGLVRNEPRDVAGGQPGVVPGPRAKRPRSIAPRS